MKRAVMLFVGSLAATFVFAQCGDAWVKVHGFGAFTTLAEDIFADKEGNSYVTGNHYGAYFDSILLNCNGVRCMFIAKYDVNGKVQWANTTRPDVMVVWGNSVAADEQGNVYVTGVLFDVAHFEAPNDTVILVSRGEADIYIAKYAANGNLVWVKQIGGRGYDYGKNIYWGADNFLYFIGTFADVVVFDGDTLISDGWQNAVLAKLDTAGNFVWVKHTIRGPGGYKTGWQLTQDKQMNIYVAGLFEPGSYFDTIQMAGYGGFFDAFIAKYDSAGNLLWVREGGGPSREAALGIAVDANGNSYISGFFDNVAVFEGTSLNSAGGEDIFLAKYSSAGDLVWVKSFGGPGGASDIDYDLGYDLAIDQEQFLYMTGAVTDSARFDNIIVSTLDPTATGYMDVFLSKIDTSGKVLWVKTAGGRSPDEGYGIAVTDNTVLLCGVVALGQLTPAYFDSLEVNRDMPGGYAFVWKTCKKAVGETDTLPPTYPDFLIYPNPSGGEFHIQYKLPADIMEATLCLYDIRGSEMARILLRAEQNTHTIPITTWPTGAYLYILKSPDGQSLAEGKVVKQ